VEDADQYWEEGAQEVVSYLHEDVGVSVSNSKGLDPVNSVCIEFLFVSLIEIM
jgi:hypothetical protein